ASAMNLNLSTFYLFIFQIISLIICLSSPASANQNKEIKYQKINGKTCLVLSGGGARGAAHIGVIKVIEKAGLKIDCITGTSMGAVVGGLYAAGLSSDELEQAITEIDWINIFEDATNREALSFRRKSEDFTSLVKARAGVNENGINFPKGFVQGQKLKLTLNRLLIKSGANNITDFDKLVIPFRAVATDIGTGLPVVLSKGDLTTSILASMAIPGVVEPVEINGQLLVDGFVSNNIPIDVAKKLGADRLIAVEIGSPLAKTKDLKSVLDITSQLTTIMTQQNTRQQLKLLEKNDIHLRPDLGDLGTMEFKRAKEAIAIGEKSAEAINNQLIAWAANQTEIKTTHQFTAKKINTDKINVDFIEVINTSNLSDDVILAHLGLNTADSFNIKQLERGISKIHGLDLFKSVSYKFKEHDGQNGLVIIAEEKDWGVDYLRFSFDLEDDFDGETAYNFGLSYTQVALNAYNGEWRNELRIGESPRLFSEIYQPLDAGLRYFTSAFVSLNRFNTGLFNEVDKVAEYRVSIATLGGAIGRQLDDWGEVRTGLRRSWGTSDLRIGSPILKSGSFDDSYYFASFTADTLDDVSFPTSGFFSKVEYKKSLKFLGADNDYQQLRFAGGFAQSINQHSFLAKLNLNSTLTGDTTPYTSFRLGGQLNLSAYNRNELAGGHSGLLAAIYYYNLTEQESLLSMPMRVGFSLEIGNVWMQKEDFASTFVPSGSLFLGVDTLLGPLYLGAGLGENGRHAVHFTFGKTF
ncbi:MAG: BamA/TamA family outer membrane protein, partial [Methylococcaceae bacterium]|nr:BamA/TamA family outer membrane protein [Methylococcaceae bacterium]